jgi:hypothetical protein
MIDNQMNNFRNDFWRQVEQLLSTLSSAGPIVGGFGLQEVIASYRDASPERQEQMRHELGVLVARLIQVDRAVEACHQHEATVGSV